MSLSVKKAVYDLITTILILGGYVSYVFIWQADTNIPRIGELQFWGRFMLILIGVTIVAKIVLMILFSIYRTAVHGDEDSMDFMDERDKLIELKSERNGNYLFMVALMGAMIPAAMGYPLQYFFIILISGGFLAGILGDIFKIYYYSEGI